jgi:hypothetical protein
VFYSLHTHHTLVIRSKHPASRLSQKLLVDTSAIIVHAKSHIHLGPPSHSKQDWMAVIQMSGGGYNLFCNNAVRLPDISQIIFSDKSQVVDIEIKAEMTANKILNHLIPILFSLVK